MRPRDIKLSPDELYVTPKVKDFDEYTLLRGWMVQWLKLVKWYWLIEGDPGADLGALFDAPFIGNDWKRTAREEEFLRFGLLWKVYDEVLKMGHDWCRRDPN